MAENQTNKKEALGHKPLIDRGYQPQMTKIAKPGGTAGHQPSNQPTNEAPKPPKGGTAIQPPPKK